MQAYIIQINRLEELQMTRDLDELERIFLKAKSTIVQGEAVIMMRTNPGGDTNKVNELTTEMELEQLKAQTFKYL